MPEEKSLAAALSSSAIGLNRDDSGMQSQYLYGTYVSTGTTAGAVNIEILGESFSNVPRLGHLEGQYMGSVYYNTPGTDSFVKANYPGLGFVVVEMVGGGGGSGGCISASSGESAGSHGGSGGSYGLKKISADTLLTSETVTVGAGGSGGAAGANDGGDGSNSTYGSHFTAVGGQGGDAGTVSSTVAGFSSGAPGNSVIGSGGDLNIYGGDGWFAFRGHGGNMKGGWGGGTMFHSGARRPSFTDNNAGLNARGEGGGASGCHTVSGGPAQAGGDGANGIVIVHLYTGFTVGCTVLCVRTKLVPLTVVGIVVGT